MNILAKFNLTDDQKTFLGTYTANDSRVDDTLNKLSLDRDHYQEWLNQPDFVLAYRQINRIKKEFLIAENDILARQELNRQLRTGHKVETICKRKIKPLVNPVTGEIEEVEEIETATKRSPLDAGLLKLAMQQTTLEAALSKLAQDGMLSQEQYQQIIALSEEYEEKTSQVIDVNAIAEEGDNDGNNQLAKAQRWLEATLVGIVNKANDKS